MQDIISELIGRLKSAERSTAEVLASGTNIHNFESYQRLVGKREGLFSALEIIEALLTEDDEDNN